MRVLVAPDKFKGSLTASEVADAICEGLSSRGVDGTPLPLADGGDGTVAAAVAAGFESVAVRTEGATGNPVRCTYAYDGSTAVVEVASSCGLATLPGGRLRPMTASSRGFGLAVRSAIDGGARRVVLALGGSASTDGGAGMLHALGVRFKDVDGRDMAPSGASLSSIAKVDVSGLIETDGVELVVATDVDNPLLGPTGAAAVFAPQKGADHDQVQAVEVGLAAWVDVLRDVESSGASAPATLAMEPGSGSAGGLGFACLWLGAARVSGADFVLDLVGFDAAVQEHDAVITGEGRLDSQSLDGKLPSAVARRSAGRPLYLVVGVNALDMSGVMTLGARAVRAIADVTDIDPRHDPDLSRHLLARVAADLAEEFG